jgi:hypothetical protein
MQGVTSYHFRLDNSVDTNTVETNQIATSLGKPPTRPTIYEGDIVPPIARYWPNSDGLYSGMIIIGKDRYTYISASGSYHPLGFSTSSWDYWSNTGGLNNPEEFMNFTLDKAQCATILGEEQVDGVDTIHARYNLITDDLSVRSTNGDYVYVRDYWIEKGTHYVRRLQTHEIFSNWEPCEQAFSWDNDNVRYTTGILTYSNFNVPISPPIK